MRHGLTSGKMVQFCPSSSQAQTDSSVLCYVAWTQNHTLRTCQETRFGTRTCRPVCSMLQVQYSGPNSVAGKSRTSHAPRPVKRPRPTNHASSRLLQGLARGFLLALESARLEPGSLDGSSDHYSSGGGMDHARTGCKSVNALRHRLGHRPQPHRHESNWPSNTGS